MRNWLIAELFILLAGATVAWSSFQPLQTASSLKINDAAPRFSLTDENGNQVTLDQYTGKIVVLEWFDPGNDYTRRDYKAGTPKAIAAKYADKKVIWLSINSTRTSETSWNKRWIDRFGLGYHVLDDHNQTVAGQYNITTAPFYYIIDANGHIAYMGPFDDDENRALDQKPKDGRINWIDRALGEMTTGQQVSRPQPRVYGDPLNQ
jgi:peroxiredoxin Q/BCP